MANADKHYPNLKWPQFAVCNDDATGAFEDMARRLFSLEFLGGGTIPHCNGIIKDKLFVYSAYG